MRFVVKFLRCVQKFCSLLEELWNEFQRVDLQIKNIYYYLKVRENVFSIESESRRDGWDWKFPKFKHNRGRAEFGRYENRNQSNEAQPRGRITAHHHRKLRKFFVLVKKIIYNYSF